MSFFSKRAICTPIIAAIGLGCLTPLIALAQDAPAKKVFERPKQFRKLAADVLTTIPVARSADECYTTMPMPDLALAVKADNRLRIKPNTEATTTTLASKSQQVTFRRAVWNLEFTFKPLRMVRVDLPQPSGKMRNQLIWYMIYKVRNPGEHFVPVSVGDGEYKLERRDEIDPANPGVRFIPFFVLKENREINRYFRDKIIPLALPQILKREFRTGEFKAPKVYNSAQMMQTPIKAGEERWGIVTWENVDRRIDFLSIYLQGLSNAYKWQETRASYNHENPAERPAAGRKYQNKTLQLNFWRPGDEFLETDAEIIYGIPGKFDKPQPGQPTRAQPGWRDHQWLWLPEDK